MQPPTWTQYFDTNTLPGSQRTYSSYVSILWSNYGGGSVQFLFDLWSNYCLTLVQSKFWEYSIYFLSVRAFIGELFRSPYGLLVSAQDIESHSPSSSHVPADIIFPKVTKHRRTLLESNFHGFSICFQSVQALIGGLFRSLYGVMVSARDLESHSPDSKLIPAIIFLQMTKHHST